VFRRVRCVGGGSGSPGASAAVSMVGAMTAAATSVKATMVVLTDRFVGYNGKGGEAELNSDHLIAARMVNRNVGA
jgi:hypothetical protein